MCGYEMMKVSLAVFLNMPFHIFIFEISLVLIGINSEVVDWH